VAATAPLELYGSDVINAHLRDLHWVSERALAHEAVVEAFLDAGDVLPLNLFTLFADDERARNHVRGRRAEIGRILDGLAGCREWSLRIGCVQSVEGSEVPPEAPAQSGREFLARKRRRLDGAKSIAAHAADRAEAVVAELAGLAREVRRPGSTSEGARDQVAGAVLLVRTADEEDLQRRTRELAAEGIGVTLTGPWPAYHFIEEVP
jgi:hypothetical protein